MDDLLGADGMTKLHGEQPLQFRPRALLRDEKLFVRKIRPTNPRILAKRMMLRERHDNPFGPKRERPVVPGCRMACDDRNIDSVPGQSAQQPILASIDGAYIYIRKAAMEFDERRVHVSGRGGGVNADRQEAKFAAASAFDPPELRLHAIEDSRGARDELPPHRGKAGAALRPFEQDHVKLALDLVQPAAQGGLAYVQGFRRLSQAAVLGRHDSQSQITKLYIHTTHFIGLMGRLSQTLPPLASPSVSDSA
jgi:hypothetical protein